MRDSIFEIVRQNTDYKKEAIRVNNLIFNEPLILSNDSPRTFTVSQFVDGACFFDWKNRGHFIDLEDFLASCEYEHWKETANIEISNFLNFAEISYNIWKLAEQNLLISSFFEPAIQFYQIKEILDDCLAWLNCKAVYFEDKEQVIIVEEKPEVSAVCECLAQDLSMEMLRYNHYKLRGNLKEKKRILLYVAADLEPKKKQLKILNETLTDNIFYLLNNLDLRHNNCSEGYPNYKKVVAEMTPDEMEKWYDELYKMILLANLELDNNKRRAEVAALKKRIEGE